MPLIIGTFSLSLLKLIPFYRDTNPKIFVNSIKFVGNHTSKFHNQLVYNSNVLNFLPLNLLKGFSKTHSFLNFSTEILQIVVTLKFLWNQNKKLRKKGRKKKNGWTVEFCGILPIISPRQVSKPFFFLGTKKHF